MNHILVREAKISDKNEIASIHVHTWQNAYRGQLPDSFLDSLSLEKRMEFWQELLSNPQGKTKVFVGEVDGKIAGFCSIGPSRDDDANESVGELYAIYIDSQRMNRGVGSALMKKSLEYLREAGFQQATLWVLTSNHKARMFYENHGWAPDGATQTDDRKDFSFYETRYAIKW